jgi:hypothetical protein
MRRHVGRQIRPAGQGGNSGQRAAEEVAWTRAVAGLHRQRQSERTGNLACRAVQPPSAWRRRPRGSSAAGLRRGRTVRPPRRGSEDGSPQAAAINGTGNKVPGRVSPDPRPPPTPRTSQRTCPTWSRARSVAPTTKSCAPRSPDRTNKVAWRRQAGSAARPEVGACSSLVLDHAAWPPSEILLYALPSPDTEGVAPAPGAARRGSDTPTRQKVLACHWRVPELTGRAAGRPGESGASDTPTRQLATLLCLSSLRVAALTRRRPRLLLPRLLGAVN